MRSVTLDLLSSPSNRAAICIVWFVVIPVCSRAEDSLATVARGEKVFNQTCATGYCHGMKGIAAGAPRLAARGFDRVFIETTVTHGISGTAMPAFGTVLDRNDMNAVIAYVGSLNGITGSGTNRVPAAALSPDGVRGRDLFFDATRGFARCSTCHEVGGVGIPVATPIAVIPTSVENLRNLAAPDVRTAVIGGESMPVLVVSAGKRRTLVYDLTSAPPVLRTEDPAAIRITEGSAWKHSTQMGSYNDAELQSILTYLRAVIR